jgi:hypothetical protein
VSWAFQKVRVSVIASALFALVCSASEAEPTFSKQVWPILERRCVECHQAGAIGPMPLSSYREVRPWARAIRQAVLQRTMPPWHASQTPHAFRNDRSLTQAEIETILAWVDAGCPEGSALPAFVPKRAPDGWHLGTPDLVVEVPGFAIPASGQLAYSFLIVPLHLERDTWVRAAEYRIDQRGAIHHINAFIRPPGSSYLAGWPMGEIFQPTVAERGKRREGEKVFDRRQLLLGYEPGYMPAPWLEDGAKLISAGSDLVFELHYNPNGTPAVDHSRLALYFASEPPRKRVLAIDTLRDLDLQIPPGEAKYVSNAEMTLAEGARLLSVQPHMHLRGASMRVRAVFPDGRSEDLVNVPRYDFNWQTTYALADPLTLPLGTRIESQATFDNSANNRFNPDPSKTVHWGDQTTDEMHVAFLELVIDAHADPDRIFKILPRMVGQPAATSGSR